MKIKPWLEKYDTGVPHTLRPYPEKTLIDIVKESAIQKPDNPAILFKGTRLSYAQLERLSDTFATALLELGIMKGDRVTLLLPNSPQLIICQLGSWKVGAIVSPINPFYTDPELTHAVNEVGSKVAVVLSPFYEKIKRLQPLTTLHRIIATNIKEYLPFSKRFLFTIFKEKQDGHRIELHPEDLWLADLLRKSRSDPPPAHQVYPEDPALLLFTGGTTGPAKAALSFHQGLLMAGMQINAWMGDIREEWQDVTLLVMPMFHAYGNIGTMSSAIVGHSPMVPVPNPRDLDDLIDTIHETRPAYLCGVPTLFIALLNHPTVSSGQANFTSIKLCICGAAPLMAETKRRFEDLTGGRIVEGYSLTESVLAMVMTPIEGSNKDGAIGLPLPDVDIRIVDDLIGEKDLSSGQVGEILIGAPQLMLEYWGRPKETADTLRNGWLFTGDLGYLDEEGYLYLVDRKKDVIKPSGFQVWPREVEEVIASHPAVAEVGVAGIPDQLRGEVVKAWVVVREGQQVSAAELRAYCRQSLAAYKVPRRIKFCTSLPKSSVGKVLRRELVAMDLKASPKSNKAD